MVLTKEEMQKLVRKKIEELHRAVDELRQHTIPYTPLPNSKTFKLLDDKETEILWPAPPNCWHNLKVGTRFFDIGYDDNHYIADEICDACKYQPAKILQVIRRIDAAIEWCKRRTEGRKRAAEEILKQQKKAVDALTALAVAYKLTRSP